jgi:regulator of sirC expression with transglutaminase-like and TPR domain
MAEACWLSERDAQLARARRIAATEVASALALIDGVLAQAPDDLETLRAKADVLAEAGDEPGALRCLERVLALDPSDPRALIDRADLERDLDRARALYERAIAALEARGASDGVDTDLRAARRGRAATLAKEAS